MLSTEDLLATLNGQRRHILGILEGLDDAALRRVVLPSGWNCAGLVQHLALDVERFWFRAVLLGDQSAIESLPTGAEGWQVPPDVPATSVLDLYRDETRQADDIIKATPLDTPPAWWPDFFGRWHLDSLAGLLLHVIAETATHAGHLDAARELIDGRTWLILTE